jgi:hypothetical protein
MLASALATSIKRTVNAMYLDERLSRPAFNVEHDPDRDLDSIRSLVDDLNGMMRSADSDRRRPVDELSEER